ncbi:MAG: glycosyltransferase family 4 protein [Candidatus Sericytochromatia bacterium]|nr:glycosyltransferase family 4 protein [Candidatus Sericytochromatia bacterium]
MKIALVCSEVIAQSGHGRYVLELARRLALRHEVHVFSHLYEPVPGVVHHPVWAHLGVNLLRLLTFQWCAGRALSGQHFDVVHSIGGVCREQNVVTVQFCQRAWGQRLQQLTTLDRVARSQGLPSVLGAPWWRQIYHDVYWRVADQFEVPVLRPGPERRLIAVSGSVRAELGAHYGVPAQAVTVIPNGVEPDDFSDSVLAPWRALTREKFGFDAQSRVVLFIGEFFRKGLSTAIQALARWGDPDAHLLVVGRGPEGEFRKLAEDLGVSEYLHFAGFVADPRPYFAASDVFLFPTLYEPFGMVVLEAMASGLPIITTRLAGVSDVIRNGVEGYLVDDPMSVTAYAEHLRFLFENEARRDEMATAARRAAQGVSWNEVAARTEAVYHSLKR